MITPCGQARRTVCQPAARQVAQLAADAGSLAVMPIARPGAAAAAVGGAGEGAEPGVARRAAVVKAGVGEVDDPAARRAEPQQPLLLVAVPAVEGLVELADPIDRGAPHGEVRPPDHLGLHVLRAQVERRYRRVLATAAARRMALEARADRTSERLRFRMSRALPPRARRASRAARTRRRRRTRSGRPPPHAAPCSAPRSARGARRAGSRARRSAPPPRLWRRSNRRRPPAAREEWRCSGCGGTRASPRDTPRARSWAPRRSRPSAG